MTTTKKQNAGVAAPASCVPNQTPLKVLAHSPVADAGSQVARVAEALRRGESLTPLDALNRFGCFRLAAIIHILRRAGMPIASASVGVVKPNGRIAHVARYRKG